MYNGNPIETISQEEKTIFDIIQKRGPITKNDIMLMTKMKLTTLNRIMQPMLNQGLIIEADIGESTGGRKPILYDVNPNKYYIVGIDISRTYTQVVLTNLKMQTLYVNEFKMSPSYSPEKTVKIISDWLSNILYEANIDRSMILGVGLGTVGPLRRKEGIMAGAKGFEAPGWDFINIKGLLEKELALPIAIDNGANTAVLAEYLFGSGKGLNNIVYINCGIGIRAGVISSGTLVRTINDAEDALGHMVIDVDGELCSCGNHGCVECYSSIPAITDRFISAMKRGRISQVSKDIPDIKYKDILVAAQQGDPLSREVVIESALIFGVGISNYINLVNPELIILSGPLIKHSDLFYEVSAETALRRSYLGKENKMFFTRGGHYKGNAMAVGAAAMVIEKALRGNYVGGKS